MRPRTTVVMLATAAVVLAGCGDGDADEQPATQERIADLEDELERTRQSTEDLLDENERLLEEVQLLTSEAPEDADAVDLETDEDEPAEGDPPTEEPVEPIEPERLRTPEGLIEQLRTLFELDRGPDDDFEPGVTGWTSAEPPAGLEEHYETPGELAFDLAAALEARALGTDTWETTTRVLLDDEDPDLGYVAVLSWGYADDAVVGADWRMTITHGDDGWSPGGAEQRFHCRRGVTDEDVCL